MKQLAAVTKHAGPSAEFALPITLQVQNHEPIQAHIRRVSTGFFLIASPVMLKPDQKMAVLLAGRAIDAQVTYCHLQPRGDYQLGVQMLHDADQPLRTEPRIPMDMAAELNVAGIDTPIAARLVNISASGLGLDIPQQVASGEIAYVKLAIGFAFGEIRHCSKVSGGFRAGLRLDEFIQQGDELDAARNRSGKHGTLARLFGRKN